MAFPGELSWGCRVSRRGVHGISFNFAPFLVGLSDLRIAQIRKACGEAPFPTAQILCRALEIVPR